MATSRPSCPQCHRRQVIKKGMNARGVQRWQCQAPTCTQPSFITRHARRTATHDRAAYMRAYRRRVKAATQAQHKVYHRSKTVEWATPHALFDRLHAEFGMTLDVCATPDNAKCPRYFTQADDGLTQDWRGEVCWMNPPYGRTIGAWVAKAAHSAQQGATVICLLPARPDTRWWQTYVLTAETRFLAGRLTFGGATNPAPFASAVVIFRPEPTTR